MIYLAYFVLAFSVIQLLVAFVNLLFRQNYSSINANYRGLVSVLIPARNEEKNIANILNDLQNQNYHNIEVFVFNDQSTDKTEEIITEFSKRDSKIKLVNSNGLPEGWLGKNYACYSLSKHAKGSFLLFLDADVRISNDIIINTISHSIKHNLGLLSIFPKQIMMTLGERIAVPNMNFILLSLLPLILVRKSTYSSLSAANGQFMLFNSTNYFDTNPHELMKADKVEDIEIARYFKNKNIPVACLTGNDTIKCRMYEGFSEAVNGFSKNVINFFGKSFIVATLFWLVTTFGFISTLVSFDHYVFILYLLTIISTRVFISIVSRQNILLNLMLAIPQQITMGIFIYKAFINTTKKQYQWKGRNIS